MIKRETSAAKRYAADWQILFAIHRRRRVGTWGRILSQFIILDPEQQDRRLLLEVIQVTSDDVLAGGDMIINV